MKIHGTAKGGALSKKDFGVAFGGGVAPAEYAPIVWTNKTEYSATDSSGALNKTSANASWSQTCKSTNSGTTISMKFVNTTNHHTATGLSWYDGTGPNGSSGNDNEGVSFGVYSTTSNAGNIIIDGTPGSGYGNPLDEWEIILTPTSCLFKVAGVLVHTATSIPAQTYYGVCTSYYTSTGLVSASLKS